MQALLLELVKNNPPRAGKELLEKFDKETIKKVRDFHKSMWGYYKPTPLVELKELASWLGVKRILVKDESRRFGLKAERISPIISDKPHGGVWQASVIPRTPRGDV